MLVFFNMIPSLVLPETFKAFKSKLTLKRQQASRFYTACPLPFSVNVGVKALKVSNTAGSYFSIESKQEKRVNRMKSYINNNNPSVNFDPIYNN